MLVGYWVTAGILSLLNLAVGGMKLAQSKDKLVASGQAWAVDVSSGVVKLVGLLEVLGAVGVILPKLLSIAPVLSPFAAIGLALIQVVALIVHVRRAERGNLPVNAVLILLAAAVAVLGFLTLN